MAEEDDLGIRPDIPFIERFSFARSLLLESLDLKIIDYVVMVLLFLIVGGRIFSSVDSLWVSAGVFLALFVTTVLGALIFVPLLESSWMVTLFFGRPVFGELGGPARNIFFTLMKASDALHVKLYSEDADNLEKFNRLLTELQEDELKLAYRERISVPRYGESEGDDFENRWASIWEEQILDDVRTGNLTFRDVLFDRSYAFLFAKGSVLQMYPRMHRLFLLFGLAILYLTTLLLEGRVQILFVIQFAVFLSFVFALVWYMAYSLSGSFSAFVDLGNISEKLRSKYWQPLKPLIGQEFRPKEVRLEPKFFEAMRAFQVRLILSGLGNSFSWLVVVGISLLIGRLLSIPGVDEWYAALALAVISAPFFLMVGFYLISVILQYSRRVLAPVIAGLVGAALPYAIHYTITGEFNLADVESALSSVIAGVGILMTTVVTTHIQKSLEGET